ncbi:unnamed protein product [Pedinophyceae sp. YPF-701]|nr:unnamed protein product [Pedinophyceae sp. YPF-701]
MRAGIAVLPSLWKDTAGEDAGFASGNCFAICDGVGWYARDGIDAGEFSRELVASLQENEALARGEAGLVEALDEAHESALSPGGSTCLLGRVVPWEVEDDYLTLQLLNLGDCNVLVLRNGVPIPETPLTPRLHAWNQPYQLTGIAEDPDALTDYAEDGEEADIVVRPGDIIVAGSDGLFDNVWPDEIATVIAEHVRAGAGFPVPVGALVAEAQGGGAQKPFGNLPGWMQRMQAPTRVMPAADPELATMALEGTWEPQHAAEELAALAQANADDETYHSPYFEGMKEQGQVPFPYFGPGGGKADDTTVVVAVVV